MKRAELFHPRVFKTKGWAQGYYNRNAKNIQRTGKRFAGILKKSGFKGGRILDAGCGFAAVPIELAKSFPETKIIGIDMGEPLLELGDSLIEKAGLSDRITLQKGDVQKVDFNNDEFDVVVNTYLLHIVEDPVAMLNELERVAKPDGKIMITDLRRFWLGYIIKKFGTTFTLKEAMEIIGRSDIRQGKGSNGPIWWDYMAGM